MPALPLGKLAILAVKQIAKPIAKGLKNGAKNNDTFKNYIIMPVAQGWFLISRSLFFSLEETRLRGL